MLSSHEKIGYALGFIGVAIFAGSLPTTRLAVAHLDAWFVTAARAGIAGLCALAVLLVMRRPLPPKAAWPRLMLIILGVVFGFPFFTALAMQNVPAAHGGVVLGVLPLATAATAVVLAGERPGFGFWIAAIDRRHRRDRIRAAQGRQLVLVAGRLATGARDHFGGHRIHGIGRAFAQHAGMGSDLLGAGRLASGFARRHASRCFRQIRVPSRSMHGSGFFIPR